MWWRFRVRGAAGRRLWFHLTNVMEILGGGELDQAVPVMREAGGAWRRLDGKFCRKLGPRGPFEFAADFRADDVELAWCYPYGLRELAGFLAALPRRERKLLRVSRIGTTAEGRALPMIGVGASSRRRARPAIWLTARNHAGEVAGSHAIEGLLRALTGASPAARWLRENCVVHAVPFVDLDSVVEGRYGKDHVPRDHNRDWSAGTVRPETAAVIRAIGRSRRAESPAVFIDLHCPGAGEPRSYPVMPNPTGLADWARIAHLARCVERAAPESFPVRLREWSTRSIDWAAWVSEGTTSNWARDAGMTALTFELTYGRTVRGALATEADYRAFGASLVRSLAGFMKGEMSGRRPPCCTPPRIPAAPGWLTRRLPVKARLSGAAGGGLRIDGEGRGSRVLVRTNRTLNVGTGRRARFIVEAVNSSHRALAVKAVLLPRTADGYWTGQLVELTVRLPPGRSRRRVTAPLPPPAAGFRVGLEIADLSGLLELRVVKNGSQAAAREDEPGGPLKKCGNRRLRSDCRKA
jgi:predicted deacylase